MFGRLFGRRREDHVAPGRDSRERRGRPSRQPARGRDDPDPAERWPEEVECPACWGYGSVACRRCNETGDLDRGNGIDRDCRYCQGWGAVTCRTCGGSGTRRR